MGQLIHVEKQMGDLNPVIYLLRTGSLQMHLLLIKCYRHITSPQFCSSSPFQSRPAFPY